MNRYSLRTQLIAWNILALAILLAASGVAVRWTVFSILTGAIDGELRRQAQKPPPPPRRSGRGPGEGGQPRPRDNFHGDGPHGGAPHQNGDPGHFDDPSARGSLPRFTPPRFADDSGGFPPFYADARGRPVTFRETRRTTPYNVAAISDVLRERRDGQFTQTQGNDDGQMAGEPIRVLTLPLRGRGDEGEIVGVVQVAAPLASRDRALAGLDAALMLFVPIGLLGAGVGGAYLTNRVLRRVGQTARAAERIKVQSARDLSARLPVVGNDEFSQLAQSFNGLLSRLEQAFQKQEMLLERQRRFTADASHELKTPLTVIKGTASMTLGLPNSDVASYRKSLSEINGAADRMAMLVQDLLLLARADAGQLGRETVELPLQDVLVQAISATCGARERVELWGFGANNTDEPLTVLGNENELVRIFANLLANALRHTPAPPVGQVCLSARAIAWESAADANVTPQILVQVADNGIGIAPEHLPHLGERFYRVDDARARGDGGTGLGLSICKSIVEAHGGTMRIESVPGKGTTVSVWLPCVL